MIPRIENVLNDKLPKEAKNCFIAIAQHRNKMVHFFHEAHDVSYPEKVIKTIVIEQSAGWFFLRRLLKKWDDVFNEYETRIQTFNYQMKGHQVYLDTAFKNIKPEIKADKLKGAIYRKCSFCEREASKEHKLSEQIVECKCKVCLITGWVIKISCPNCKTNIEVEESWNGEKKCTCGFELDQEKLSKKLDTEFVTKDNYIDYYPKNCAYCLGYHSVVQHHDYFVCTQCISVFSECAVCGWCSEGQVGGDLEQSYLTGCEFCDGHADWVKND